MSVSANPSSGRSLFTLAQKIFVVKCYYKNGEAIAHVLERLEYRFGRIFGGKRSLPFLQQIVDSFEKTGSVREPVYHGGIEKFEPEGVVEEEMMEEGLVNANEGCSSKMQPIKEEGEDEDDEETVEIIEQEEDKPLRKIKRESARKKTKRPTISTERRSDSAKQEEKDVLICAVCGNKVQRRMMHYHMKSHTNPKVPRTREETKWQCDICNKELSSKHALAEHKKTHLDPSQRVADQIVCEICAKVSLSRELHKSHMRVHLTEKLYKCTDCTMSFKTRQGLKKHERTHTGEKPLACTVCDARFRAHTTLSIHMRLHTGERPYICEYCDQRFIGKPSLNVSARRRS